MELTMKHRSLLKDTVSLEGTGGEPLQSVVTTYSEHYLATCSGNWCPALEVGSRSGGNR
jgi:hypothetical protein